MRVTKSQYNEIDNYLASVGLWRKPTAKDGTCLFRAVAEQLFHTQTVHVDVRKAVIAFIRKHQTHFNKLVPENETTEQYLQRLSHPLEFGGRLEIFAVSVLYRRDIIIYTANNRHPIRWTNHGFPKTISLCYCEGFYDTIYPWHWTEVAAICQSIVYELLYELMGVQDPVQIARDLQQQRDRLSAARHDTAFEDWEADVVEENGETPLFFHRVTMALLPTCYRNVEYDVWQEQTARKEITRKNGPVFCAGDKCQIILRGFGGRECMYNGHIQDLSPDRGPVTVFVQELGQKLVVAYQALIALPNSGSKTNRKKDQIAEKLENLSLGGRSGESPSHSFSPKFGGTHRFRQQINAAGHPIKRSPLQWGRQRSASMSVPRKCDSAQQRQDTGVEGGSRCNSVPPSPVHRSNGVLEQCAVSPDHSLPVIQRLLPPPQPMRSPVDECLQSADIQCGEGLLRLKAGAPPFEPSTPLYPQPVNAEEVPAFIHFHDPNAMRFFMNLGIETYYRNLQQPPAHQPFPQPALPPPAMPAPVTHLAPPQPQYTAEQQTGQFKVKPTKLQLVKPVPNLVKRKTWCSTPKQHPVDDAHVIPDEAILAAKLSTMQVRDRTPPSHTKTSDESDICSSDASEDGDHPAKAGLSEASHDSGCGMSDTSSHGDTFDNSFSEEHGDANSNQPSNGRHGYVSSGTAVNGSGNNNVPVPVYNHNVYNQCYINKYHSGFPPPPPLLPACNINQGVHYMYPPPPFNFTHPPPMPANLNETIQGSVEAEQKSVTAMKPIPRRFQKLLNEEARGNPSLYPGRFEGQALIRHKPLGNRKRKLARLAEMARIMDQTFLPQAFVFNPDAEEFEPQSGGEETPEPQIVENCDSPLDSCSKEDDNNAAVSISESQSVLLSAETEQASQTDVPNSASSPPSECKDCPIENSQDTSDLVKSSGVDISIAKDTNIVNKDIYQSKDNLNIRSPINGKSNSDANNNEKHSVQCRIDSSEKLQSPSAHVIVHNKTSQVVQYANYELNDAANCNVYYVAPVPQFAAPPPAVSYSHQPSTPHYVYVNAESTSVPTGCAPVLPPGAVPMPPPGMVVSTPSAGPPMAPPPMSQVLPAPVGAPPPHAPPPPAAMGPPMAHPVAPPMGTVYYYNPVYCQQTPMMPAPPMQYPPPPPPQY